MCLVDGEATVCTCNEDLCNGAVSSRRPGQRGYWTLLAITTSIFLLHTGPSLNWCRWKVPEAEDDDDETSSNWGKSYEAVASALALIRSGFSPRRRFFGICVDEKIVIAISIDRCIVSSSLWYISIVILLRLSNQSDEVMWGQPRYAYEGKKPFPHRTIAIGIISCRRFSGWKLKNFSPCYQRRRHDHHKWQTIFGNPQEQEI